MSWRNRNKPTKTYYCRCGEVAVMIQGGQFLCYRCPMAVAA